MRHLFFSCSLAVVQAAFAGFARAELVDITAAVRTSGSGNYNTTGSSSGDQSYQKPGAAFNGVESDRFYMTYMPRLCFNIQSGFSQGKDIVLKKYVITQTGNYATDRIPSKWSLYGSADGGKTYTIPLDIDRTVTPADIEIDTAKVSYRITVEIPDNEYPINAYRFTFLGAMKASGVANSTITIGEVYLWGEIREASGQIFYEAEDYEGSSDGFAHGITVKPFLPDPATVKVEYSASEDGPWSETQPVISRPCAATPVYFRLSVSDDETYQTVVDSRTVTLTKDAFNLTALVREKEKEDAATYHGTETNSDEDRTHSRHEVMWDGKWSSNADGDRWYGCTWLTYVLSDDFLPDSNFILHRYNLRCAGGTLASRRPKSWKIYGSRDGVSYDYLVDEQSGREWTDADNKQSDGSYLMTIEIPDNRRAYRAYKFTCSSPITLEMAEIEYFAERVDNGKSVDYAVTNFEGVYSGFARTIDVAVTEPAEGATIRWALAEEGPYADVKPTFVRPCNQRVWFEITADGYMPHRDFGTVKITKLPKEPVDIVSYLRDPQLPGTPLFTVSSKKTIKAGAVANLFNGRTETGDGDRWFVQSVSSTSPADVVWTSSDAYCPGYRFYLTSYEIWGGGTSYTTRRPKAWTLEGSMTGEEGSWKIIDEKSGVSWEGLGQNQEFGCNTEEGFRHFRFKFKSGSDITLCEIKLNGLIYRPSGLMLLLR